MLRPSRLIAASIILASLAAAVFIVGRAGVAADKKSEDVAASVASFTEIQQNPSLKATEKPTPAGSLAPSSEKPEENLTGKIATRVANELIAKNPKGPLESGGLSQIAALNPETLIDGELSAELENIDITEFQPTISISQVKIKEGTSGKTELEAYAKTVGSIIASHYLTLGTTSGTPLKEGLTKLRDAARDAFQELIAVPVPRSALSFHIKELELMAAQEKTLSAALAGDADPLRALLAVQFLENINDEFATHNEKLNTLSL